MISWRHQPPVFSIPIPVQLINRTRFFIHGCDESRQSPIRIKRSAVVCFRPGGLYRPRRLLVPLRVQLMLHRIRGYRIPIPTPWWLALQAIRFVARATANGIPFRLMAHRPGPFPSLSLPS
jgi:hypothetical protein